MVASHPQHELLTEEQAEVSEPQAWNVVLLDDQDHTYDYVIRMVQDLFGMPLERAFKVAQTVDAEGRAICLTTHKEHAELKREQISSYGPDKLIAHCKGAMSAIIEPACGDGDDGDDEE